MKKPIIGIVPLVDQERESYWMLPGYMEGIQNAGGIGIMLPLTDDPEDLFQLACLCDGFLFTGGQDISPTLYGQAATAQCGELVPGRDAMETLLLDQILDENKPLLGICRGLQFLNVGLGGTLYQDIPAQFPTDVNHRQSAAYHLPIHSVEVVADSPLAQIMEEPTIAVNSCHHQGILDLAPELRVMAYAPDGLAEAVYMPDRKFVWAVQWHPEFSHKTDENSRKLFRAFVDACK